MVTIFIIANFAFTELTELRLLEAIFFVISKRFCFKIFFTVFARQLEGVKVINKTFLLVDGIVYDVPLILPYELVHYIWDI